MKLNKSMTLTEIEKHLPEDVSIKMYRKGAWEVSVIPPRHIAISGKGAKLKEAIAEAFLWIAPAEHRCPHCRNIDLHSLWRVDDTTWKCTQCDQNFAPNPEAKVVTNPAAVETLADAKSFVKHNPDHAVVSAWEWLIHEVDDCGEEFCLETFREDLERAQHPGVY